MVGLSFFERSPVTKPRGVRSEKVQAGWSIRGVSLGTVDSLAAARLALRAGLAASLPQGAHGASGDPLRRSG